jgi:hypothetical protein
MDKVFCYCSTCKASYPFRSLGIITLGLVHYLSSSRPQEREGGKGESGTSKTYFFINFGMDEIEKSYKK